VCSTGKSIDVVLQYQDVLAKENNRLSASITKANGEIDAFKRILMRIPQALEPLIDFIGSNDNALKPRELEEKLKSIVSMVTYSLTMHEILSAFSWNDLGSESIDAAMPQATRE
jgi:hypothetical protein